jgi:hypothetical protein
MATRITNARRSGAADSVVDAIDVGASASTIELRTGTQPATADTAASGTLLATIALPDPCFGAASNGVATANAITPDTGDVAGDAGWFRVKDGNGLTIMDGSVTATGGGGDLELNTVTISVGVDIEITAWTVTMPAG